MPQLRVRGLLTFSDTIQQQLWQATLTQANDATFARIAQRIGETERQLQKLCAQHQITPAQLPLQSQQVYAWLRLLDQPARFNRHCQTLMQLKQLIDENDAARKRRADGAHWHVELANSGYWYRMRPAPKQRLHLDVLINECFVEAPEPVLQALVQMAFGNTKAHLPIVKAYAHSADYLRMNAALQLNPTATPAALSGQHYDLQQVFERVNRQFFAGALEQPHLRWSRTDTRRIMGTYQARTNTVMISQTLDDAQVPEFVIDYVMYHELLHKVLGSRFSAGRRQVHFAEFRAADQRYPRYAEAEAFLNGWVGRGFEERRA